MFPRIRELRIASGMTQTELANAINSTQQSLTEWETGKKEPRTAMLVAMADLFNVSVDYLLGRTDVPYIVRCSTDQDGIVLCFTTKELPGPWAEKLSDKSNAIEFSVKSDALQVSRKELEQLVESLVRKALLHPEQSEL